MTFVLCWRQRSKEKWWWNVLVRRNDFPFGRLKNNERSIEILIRVQLSSTLDITAGKKCPCGQKRQKEKGKDMPNKKGFFFVFVFYLPLRTKDKIIQVSNVRMNIFELFHLTFLLSILLSTVFEAKAKKTFFSLCHRNWSIILMFKWRTSFFYTSSRHICTTYGVIMSLVATDKSNIYSSCFL